MSIYRFERQQTFLNASLDDLWDFISSPQNLKTITPDYMGFDITTQNLPSKIYPGMVISYKVSPLLGIKLNWLTEITHVKDKQYFVDEQRVGPYKIWHHEHHLIPADNGIMMKDIVTYVPPYGILGDIANKIIIRKKLTEIFDYRQTRINTLFT
jgi:ligand-binding SRPBCC domain-containing protein